MTNRAVLIYDDNPELIKLKSDINNIQNWKIVRESFRQFKAERPGPGIIVKNHDTGICYRTSEEYPWIIHGFGNEVYVDSDDLKAEDLMGRPISFSRNSTIASKPGYITIRVAGAKHLDNLKGSSAVDLQNCRQFYAFYLNPNKYDAKALSEFTLTVNNEFSRGLIRNGAVKKLRYGLGNFLVCRTYGEMHKPDFTTIDLIQGDSFILRFNAKPFGLKKIDEAIEKYKIDITRGGVDASEICKALEVVSVLGNIREREQRIKESKDRINLGDSQSSLNVTKSTGNVKDAERIKEYTKSKYVEYLAGIVLYEIANTFNNLVDDINVAYRHQYDSNSWVYKYSDLPEKLLNKINDMKSLEKPNVVSLYKMSDSKTKVKLKLTLLVTVNHANKRNDTDFDGDVNITLVAVIKKGKDKKYKKTFKMRLQGDVDLSLSIFMSNVFKDLIFKALAYASGD